MAAGSSRPFSLSDIIGTLQDGITAANGTASTATGTGHFSEADEAASLDDLATVTARAALPWDSAQWGQFSWQ